MFKRKIQALDWDIKQMAAKRARAEKCLKKLDKKLAIATQEHKELVLKTEQGSSASDIDDYWGDLVDRFFWGSELDAKLFDDEVKWIDKQRADGKQLKVVPQTTNYYPPITSTVFTHGRDVYYITSTNAEIVVSWKNVEDADKSPTIYSLTGSGHVSADDIAKICDLKCSWAQVLAMGVDSNFHLALMLVRYAKMLFEEED
jgi:hypothetical protein